MTDNGYTAAELMAATIADELRNGEWGACGAYSQIPMAAFRLARLRHAPDLYWLSGAGGALNSTGRLVVSSSDARTLTGAEGVFRLEDIVDFELGGWRRVPTVGVLGGMQVDRVGSINMVGIGDSYPDLKVRGPGTVGLVFGAYFHRLVIYLHRHDRQVLVPEVDFVSSPGRTEARRRYCDPHSTGPELVVTPIAVLDFGEVGRLRLRTVHPGHTIEEVRDRTGFDLEIPEEDVPETPRPDADALRLLRETIDPDGVLREVDVRN
jgi:glutaconate CoA-transferase, subunit B